MLSSHFLHIGKTGGTAIKTALKPYAAEFGLKLHGHRVTLSDIPEGERFFFFVRHPISRFESGFYSRQRKGRPRYNVEWSDAEQAAFTRFEDANALAEALQAPEADLKTAAEAAMAGIIHVRSRLTDWFDIETLTARKGDLIVVGFHDTFNQDFETLKNRLALPSEAALPDRMSEASHPNLATKAPLSERAVSSLQDWYGEDIALYDKLRLGQF